jgi:2-keto-4-pentenoate hydratase/2-oxohepta-3-ene-1,7-dioic acid hydratase in catechol pathway
MRNGPFGSGDTVEVSLDEIGVLRNNVVSAR